MERTETQVIHQTNVIRDAALQSQLLSRREKLRQAIGDYGRPETLVGLLHEVDAALERMQKGTFGICETCHDSIENERLLADPLIRNCLDHLSPTEQRALERDLDLASEIQRGLLPKREIVPPGWVADYSFVPAGAVSGDYCDIIVRNGDPGQFYFLVGDVTGKGVSASLLMAHLHAIFRSLVTLNLTVSELVERANRIFCEGTLTTHFATLVCGAADSAGTVEICNAGHCMPLVSHNNLVEQVPPTGMPLGLFCNSEYTSRTYALKPGDSLLVYSDGVSDTLSVSGVEYGEARLQDIFRGQSRTVPGELIAAALKDVDAYRTGAPRVDDMTMMVVQRSVR